MHKTDIPQEEWKGFFENFNEQNNGRMAYIEVTDDEHYRLDYSESIAFEKINFSEIDDEHITIVIIAGENSSFKKFIDRTERIILGSENGTDEELHVISSLGRGAVIKFHEL
jgi:hypothetical protein